MKKKCRHWLYRKVSYWHLGMQTVTSDNLLTCRLRIMQWIATTMLLQSIKYRSSESAYLGIWCVLSFMRLLLSETWPWLNIKTVFPGMEIPMVKIRRLTRGSLYGQDGIFILRRPPVVFADMLLVGKPLFPLTCYFGYKLFWTGSMFFTRACHTFQSFHMEPRTYVTYNMTCTLC